MARGFSIAAALVVLFTCMLWGAGPASAKKRGCARASAVPQAATLAQSYDAILCLINQERAKRRLSKLRRSTQLTQAAIGHSTDMVARRYFAHEGLDGDTPRERVLNSGYFGGTAGGDIEEALACGWMGLSTPKALVASLMRSPEHQAILLDRGLRDVGVGLVLGGPDPDYSGGATLTLDLGSRR
jgi:uncharacterized protein YkwD